MSSLRQLRTESLPSLPLDSGQLLRKPRIAYYLDGAISPMRDNVILVLHALTGSADASGDWWRGQIGDGAPLNTEKYAVISPNLVGSCYGSTGPREVESFPRLTVRDIARSIAALLDRLGIPAVQLVTGGSLGGMVALEFAASFPGRARRAAVFAAPARLSANAIAWSHVQRLILDRCGEDGLGLAREIAMLSYRAAQGLEDRFGRSRTLTGSFAVQDWLDYHGNRFVERFSVESYRSLIDAMDSHDVGRDRGGIGERLRASQTFFTGIGIPGDRFCPESEVKDWVSAARGVYREIESAHGHDAFLLECDQVGAILREVLRSDIGLPDVAEVA